MKLHDTIDVLIGGYLSTDAAEEDYDAVLDCGGAPAGRRCRGKDLEGNLSVEQTDHMVREGAEGLGAVGFAARAVRAAVAGQPPRSAPRWAPAAASCCTTRQSRSSASRRERRSRSAGPGLIVAYSHSEAEKVEPAVTRAVKKAIGEAEGNHVQALKGALADAQQKMAEQGT